MADHAKGSVRWKRKQRPIIRFIQDSEELRHEIVCVVLGFDVDLARPVLDCQHRIRGIREQVQYHLLQLNAIADDNRRIIGKFGAKQCALSLQQAHALTAAGNTKVNF